MSTELEDKEAIRALAYLYARAVDRRDFESLAQLFLPEGILIGPQFEMCGRQVIEDEMKSVSYFKSTQHCVHNQLVELQGDRAEAETYCVAYHIIETRDVQSKMDWGIRYLDQ